MADDDVHVCPAGEILGHVDGAPVRTDETVGTMLVAAAALHVLGAAVRLMLEAELALESSPPLIEDLLAVGSVRRRVDMYVVDGSAGSTVTRPGNNLAQLGMQVVSRGDAAGLDHLGQLPFLLLQEMRGQRAAAAAWRCAADHWRTCTSAPTVARPPFQTTTAAAS
ncbi:MAG: hypothetical protein EOP19_06760 [Hyphomicrobiales bacterium]|nr:MAG: hypothetical protein EOP19_06760 [Hyphomicrobiales bacterium]